jgi:protein-tyrosine phosphatase
MDWITESIAIGNYLEAQDADALRKAGIQSVLSLDGSVLQRHETELGLARVITTVLVDGPGNELRTFRGAIESLMYLVQSKPPVLVQCHAGRSRSVAIVAGYLIRMHDIEPDEALKRIAAKREFNLASALEDLLYKL